MGTPPLAPPLAHWPDHARHYLPLSTARLTFRQSGRDMRLTDVYGEVVKQIVS